MVNDQLDLFNIAGDAVIERRRALLIARDPDPLGRTTPEFHVWCGRCGALHNPFDGGHDRGYQGCLIGIDPTWKNYEPRGHGWAGHGVIGHPGGSLLTVEELCDRWDRQYFPDCTCGHPWGLHHTRYGTQMQPPGNPLSCLAHCGCRDYVDPPTT